MHISKEKFLKYLDSYKKYLKECDDFNDALKPFFDGHPVFMLGDDFLQSYNKMLVDLCNCQDDADIFWWWLTDGSEKKITVTEESTGKEIVYDVESPEGLYDYLLAAEEVKNKYNNW